MSLHPKSDISILFANFLLPSVIMHRHQSPLLAMFAILDPLSAAVRTVSGVIEAPSDNNLFSVYLYCYAPPPVWESCLIPGVTNSDDNPVIGQCGGGQGADTWSSALMMHLRKVPGIVLNTTLLGLFAMRTGRHGMGVDLASLSTTNEC